MKTLLQKHARNYYNAKFILVILFLALSVSSFSQYYSNYIKVLNPQKNMWNYVPGKIDSATLVIQPKGLYANVELYLTVSQGYEYFSSNDTLLEIQMGFDLPVGSIVNDSWLLINNKWEKALIMDKWSAVSIYEGIVSRKRDPSILSKSSNNFYTLNVFPMAAKSSRTFKLSYLIPFNFSSNSATCALPSSILTKSYNTIKSLKVFYKEAEGFSKPRITNFNDSLFKYTTANKYSASKVATLPSFSSINNLELNFTSKNGVFASKFAKADDGFYQIMILPSKIIDINVQKKVVVVVNYNSNNKSTTTTDVLNGVKILLLNQMYLKDSFNIVFSGLTSKCISPKWISGDSASIVSAFSKLGTSNFSGYSSLSGGLAAGIDFIANNSNVGSVLLVSNSDEFDNIKSSNAFVEELKATYKSIPTIHIFDFNNACSRSFYASNQYFCGNQYVYNVISRMTAGSFMKLESTENFNSKMFAVGSMISKSIPIFEFNTSMDSGICYGRQYINQTTGSVYANQPQLIVGKYKGKLPLTVGISGICNNQTFSSKVLLSETDFFETDSVSKTIWTGNQIAQMESKTSLTNENIMGIIDYSISNRVLSLYTSFLTLEPNMVIEPCTSCNDKNDILITTNVRNETKELNRIEAYPSPFEHNLKIKIKLEKAENISIRISNVMGQYIVTLKPIANTNGVYEIDWDGKNQQGIDVPEGTYLITIISTNFNKTIKVVKKK
jgi:hypothetical protein